MVSATVSPFAAELESADEKLTAKVHHSSFKTETGTGTWLIEKCGKPFVVTGMCVFFGVFLNIAGKIQKLLKLRNTKVQRTH